MAPFEHSRWDMDHNAQHSHRTKLTLRLGSRVGLTLLYFIFSAADPVAPWCLRFPFFANPRLLSTHTLSFTRMHPRIHGCRMSKWVTPISCFSYSIGNWYSTNQQVFIIIVRVDGPSTLFPLCLNVCIRIE